MDLKSRAHRLRKKIGQLVTFKYVKQDGTSGTRVVKLEDIVTSMKIHGDYLLAGTDIGRTQNSSKKSEYRTFYLSRITKNSIRTVVS